MFNNAIMMALNVQFGANARGNNRVLSVVKPDGTVAVENLHGEGQHLHLHKPWNCEPASPVSSINDAVYDPPPSPPKQKKNSPKGKKIVAKKAIASAQVAAR